MKRLIAILVWMIQVCVFSSAQAQQDVKFVSKEKEQQVEVWIGGVYFTSYNYSSKIEKPVIYPLQTASGITVSRGYPLAPRAGERTDHPHHIGLWFNYGDVNGLDFWNNSDAIKAEEKPKYGSIHHQKVVRIKNGKEGILVASSDWVDMQGNVLLKEETEYHFSGTTTRRQIDRVTKLTAQANPVLFKDNKEGLLGLRVCRELEMPADKPEIFTDANGIATKVAVLNNEGVTGDFLTSAGKTGNAAWGTRGNWCMLAGKKNQENVAITIVDHPNNPGYPTYWHARGYGLFAANNLGQEVLSGGKEKLNFSLSAGQSVTFKHRILITNGKSLQAAELNEEATAFSKK